MNRRTVAILIAGLLLLSVPWIFIGHRDAPDETGFPAWVYYVLAMDVVFATAVAWMLHRFWDLFAGDPAGDLEPESESESESDPASPDAAP